MRAREIIDGLPDLAVGDEVRIGKFRNRRATIQGFDGEDPKRPKLRTSKGVRNVFTFDVPPKSDADNGTA